MKACVKIVVVLLIATLAMAGPTKFVSTWRNPKGGLDFAGMKVAAFVITREPTMRMGPEESLAAELRSRGLDAVAGYTVLPMELGDDQERAKEFLQKEGITGAIIMRVVDQAKTRRPKTTVYYSEGFYPSFYGYYQYGWSATYTIGKAKSDTVYWIETLVYSIELDRLLWVGESTTANPKNIRKFIKDLVDEAGKELRKAGLVKK